jgi:hypothetical protein
LIPNEEGYVRFFLRTDAVTTGRYLLTLSGNEHTDAAGKVSSFRIRFAADKITR